jgi:phosphate transport system substrate-binding protein
MRQYFRFAVLSLIAAWLLTACGALLTPSSTPTPVPMVTLKSSGSGTITTVLEALAPDFEAAKPGYKLKVIPGNSTGIGVTGILDGTLDLAAMARVPSADETAKNIQYYDMGLVGQAIIVHPSVTNITNLSRQQIIGIFSGKFTNWSEVGGPDLKIAMYIRNADDSSMKGLRKAILGETPTPATAKTLTSQEDMLISVKDTPGAIGIASWVAALATKTKVQMVAVDGIKPNDASYPMLGSCGIGYLASRKSDVQPLIDWLSTTKGKAALQQLGFVPEK